jgi:hypothetical protein
MVADANVYSNSPSDVDVDPPLDSDTHPRVDVDTARRFLELLDPDQERFIFAAGDDNSDRVDRLRAEAKELGRAPPTLWTHKCGTLKRLLSWLEPRQADGWGVFVTVQAMKGARRCKDQLKHVRVVFLEWDRPGPMPAFPIPPSIVVQSSDGRWHVYWLVDPEHGITPNDFDAIMDRLVELGGDPSARDRARVLRLPGSCHLKRAPQRVRIVEAQARATRATSCWRRFRRRHASTPIRPDLGPLSMGTPHRGLSGFMRR